MIADLKPYPAYKDSDVPWLGRVPEHWATASVKRHYAIQLGKMLQPQPSGSSDVEVPYLKAQHVQWFFVRTSDAPTMWASPRDIDQFGISAGDLLVCEGGEGGRSGIVNQITDGYIIQNALHRVRALDQCRNDYLQYVMNAVAATGWFDAINNKATIAHFTREKFGALGMPVPLPDEQSAVVRFLDHADRRIRRYIQTKRRLIALLNEQKQAIIHRAVTRGFDPNVRFKGTGVEWLGDVPEHWEVSQLRRRWQVVDCKHVTVPFVDEGIPLASVREVQSFELDLSTAKRTTEEWYTFLADRQRAPARGDLIYCRNVSVGACAHVDTDDRFAMGQDVCLIRSQTENNRFLNYFMHSPAMQRQLSLLLIGSTFNRINVSEIKSLVLPLPPRAEQDLIASQLDSQTSVFDAPIRIAEREIVLVREYRTRFIADVVTGKIDVREAAAKLPEEVEETEDLEEVEALVEAEGDFSEAGLKAESEPEAA